jgi:outer membrane murein-binding lipoprotein Lpp
MDDKKVKELELKVNLLLAEVKNLRDQVNLLKRENNRSKSNITQIANHLNRK